MNKREQQSQQRRLQILSCALDMIVSRGYPATKIRDIAKELNISTGLFFHYFESKEKLYEELVKIGTSGMVTILKTKSEDYGPLALFEKMAEEILCGITLSPFAGRMFIFMMMARKNELAPENIKEQLAQVNMIKPFIPVIIRGQKLGEIRPGNPVALLTAYWGALQGVAVFYSSEIGLTLPESDWIVDMLRA